MFSLDSKFYRFTVQLAKIIWTNLIFSIVSLVIVTIPAAFSSLVHILIHASESNFSDFFKHLKKSFKTTVPLGLVTLFSLLFCLGILPMLSHSLFAKFIFFIFALFLVTYNINLYVLQDIGHYGKQYWLLFRESFVFSIVIFLKECLVYLIFMAVYTLTYEKFPILMVLLGISAPLFFYLKIARYELAKTDVMQKK